MEKEDSKKQVNSGLELIRLCLKSKSFDFLLIFMIGFVWCGQVFLKINVEGKDSTMLLLAVYIWSILIGVFSLVMFGSMLFLMRKIKKVYSL